MTAFCPKSLPRKSPSLVFMMASNIHPGHHVQMDQGKLAELMGIGGSK